MTDNRQTTPTKRRTINPALKMALALGPLALFFLAYWRSNLFIATGVLMVCVIVTLAVSYALLRRIPIMPLVTAVIVIIFGSLTFYFHDTTFAKIKPTVLYMLFG